MNTGFNCVRCRTYHSFTPYIRARWDTPTPHRCHACGASHAVLRGSVDVITPPVGPVSAGNRWSMWFLSSSRPLAVGLYHVRYRTTEPAVLMAWWNGAAWQVSQSDPRVVDDGDFMGWRGVLLND